MSYTAKEILQQYGVTINPKKAKETEERWNAIREMRKNIQTKKLADASICLINTAGNDHVKQK